MQGTTRDAAFDTLCASTARAIAADRTLGGLCDWIEAEAPRPVDLPSKVPPPEGGGDPGRPALFHGRSAGLTLLPIGEQDGTSPWARAQMALAFETVYGTAPASAIGRCPSPAPRSGLSSR